MGDEAIRREEVVFFGGGSWIGSGLAQFEQHAEYIARPPLSLTKIRYDVTDRLHHEFRHSLGSRYRHR